MPATMNNDQARAAFLGAAVDRSQTLPRVAWSSQNNQPIIFNLPKAGYAKYALIDFQGTLTISGSGGSISLSPKGPWNLIDNVNLQDYLGITRINTSGYSLYQWLIKRLAFGFDPANPVVTEAYSAMRYAASIGGANGAAGTYPWAMSWIVPIAADPFGFDTRGTYPFTVADGSNTLQIRMNPSLVGGTLDSVIVEETSGFTVTMSGTFGCTYYYWDVPRGTPIPVADMSLVHELRQLHDTQNITAGQEKRYALQTGRTYLEAIATLVVAGQLDTTNVSNVRFIVDGNTPTMDESLMAYLTRIYNTYRRDFPPGTFIWDFQAKPWTPADYGSLELALALNSTAQTGTSPTYLDVFMRSLYQTSQILNDLATGVAG